MKNRTVFIFFCLLIFAACKQGTQEVTPPATDSISPYAPLRDSGLTPKDSSAHHTDTSTTHTY